jgi:pimeloyl-ACP methyl ester carboxylesterase
MAAQPDDIDVVFLLPGFLGFEHFRDYAYFGDRFGTALRASLSPRVTPLVQVVAVPLPPTSSLMERQTALGKTLVDRARAIAQKRQARDIRAIHLVGHSTGGVDAHLLTLERTLSGKTWNDFDGVDVTWLRDRLRSVVSIASPHQGTCLADDSLARLFAADSPLELVQHAAEAAGEAVNAGLRILQALPRLLHDHELPTLVQSVLGSNVAWKFALDIMRSRALIDDLTPAASVERYKKLGKPLNLLRRSFVTIAGITPNRAQSAVQSAATTPRDISSSKYEPESSPPDALFLLLAQLTSGRSTACFESGQLLPNSLRTLQAARNDPRRVLAADPELIPEQLDAAVNDGVVNSVRQLMDPEDADEIAGLVVADHFDVVGHYDRALFVTDPKTGKTREEDKVSGLLHSGSRFRDDQFFNLIERLADVMQPAFD